MKQRLYHNYQSFSFKFQSNTYFLFNKSKETFPITKKKQGCEAGFTFNRYITYNSFKMDSIIRRRQHGYDYNESKVGFYYGPCVYLLNCNTFERVITVGFEANLKTYLVATESLYIFFFRLLFLYFRYRLIVRKL